VSYYTMEICMMDGQPFLFIHTLNHIYMTTTEQHINTLIAVIISLDDDFANGLIESAVYEPLVHKLQCTIKTLSS